GQPSQQNQTSVPGNTENKNVLTPDQAHSDLRKQTEQAGVPPRVSREFQDILSQATGNKPVNRNFFDTYAQEFVHARIEMFHDAMESKNPTLSRAQRNEYEKQFEATTGRLADNLKESRLGPFEMPVIKNIASFLKLSPNDIDHIDASELAQHLKEVVKDRVNNHIQHHPEDSAGNSMGYEVLGGIHASDGQTRVALQDYNQALRLDPGNQDARQGRSEVRYKLGDYLGAAKDARALLQLDPDNAPAIAMLELTQGRICRSTDHASGTSKETQANLSGTSRNEENASPLSVRSATPSNPAQSQSAQYAKQAASNLALRDYAEAIK